MGASPGPPGGDPATRPQLGPGPYSPERMLARGGAAPAGNPTRVGPRGFLDAVQELGDGGWEGATEGQMAVSSAVNHSKSLAELAEVVLECMHSSGVDVAGMPLKHKCLVLKAGEDPWTIGRQQQPNLFARLVPDESLRTVISRNHLQLAWERQTLRLKKLSPNAVLVNGTPAPQHEVVVAHGAQVSFCGRDNASPLLVFSVLLRDAAAVCKTGPTPVPTHPDMPAASQQQQQQQQQQRLQPYRLDVQPATPEPAKEPAQNRATPAQPPAVQSPPTWWHTGPPTPYSLVCVLVYGYDVTAKPLQMRTVGLRDVPLTIGRIHQPGLFEGILGQDNAQHYLCCVSRSHLEVFPVDGDPAGCFVVTNLSANPVVLAGSRRLGKGEKGAIRPSDSIDFIGGSIGGSGGPVVYLKLVLESQRSSPARASGDDTGPRTPRREPPAPRSPAAAPKPPRDPDTGQGPGQVVAPLLPPAEEAACASLETSGPPAFWLRLRGSAVRESFEHTRRRLEGSGDGMTVGRAHQQALHSEAFDVELRQYLSRDHFRIERGSDGAFRLVPVSGNPIWRVREGRRTEAVRGDPALPLKDGDSIHLFTGADDYTPDGPGSLGTLIWDFHEASSPKLRGETKESRDQMERPFLPVSFHSPGEGRGRRRGPGSVSPRATPPRTRGHADSPTKALDAPVRYLVDEDEQPDERVDMDLSFRHVNDKFAASGFRY